MTFAVALALSPAGASAGFPTTPDRGLLLYDAHNGFNYNLYTVCPDGTGKTLIAAGARSGDWSPDGEHIAYHKNDGIYISDWDGTDAELVPIGATSPGSSDAFNKFPAWSPDGRYLAFTAPKQYPAKWPHGPSPYSYRQPHKIDLVTGAVTALVEHDEWHANSTYAEHIAWTKDGSQIILQGEHYEHESTHSNTLDARRLWSTSTGAATTPSLFGDARYYAPDFRPDGDALIVGSLDGDRPDLVLTNRTGGSGSVLFNDGVAKSWPSFSPDGTEIAYSERPNPDSAEIVIRNADGSGAVTRTGVDPAENIDWGNKVADCDTGGSPSYGGVKINEVMHSYNNDSYAQFIELLIDEDDNFLPEAAPYKLIAYSGSGNKIYQQIVPNDTLRNRDDSQPYLLKTGFFPSSSEIGQLQADAVQSIFMPNGVGQLCFTATDAEEKVDCVSWGCVASPVTQDITEIPVPPTSKSSQRQGVTSDVFQIADPTPRAANVAGTGSANCGPDPDSDGDGVPDSVDDCPSTPGPASNAGCPVVDEPTVECISAQEALEQAKAKLKRAKKALRKAKSQARKNPSKRAKRKVARAKKAVKRAKSAVEKWRSETVALC